MTERPTVDTLTPLAREALRRAYARRARRQCSLDDFADGYIGGLLDSSSFSAFQDGDPRLAPTVMGVDPGSVRLGS
jgi:hypothetical protein